MANQSAVRSHLSMRPNNFWARYVTSAVAVWLLLSAFVWVHTDAQRANTWIVGALMFIVSLMAAVAPRMRFGNTLLAVWLFFSTVGLRGYSATVVHNLIVAVVVFGLSLVPPVRRTGGMFPPGPPAAS